MTELYILRNTRLMPSRDFYRGSRHKSYMQLNFSHVLIAAARNSSQQSVYLCAAQCDDIRKLGLAGPTLQLGEGDCQAFPEVNVTRAVW